MKPSAFILLLFSLTLWNCGGKKAAESTDKSTAADQPAMDTVMDVTQVVGIARIEPSGEIVTINAESAGFVKDVRFAENQPVKQGDALIILAAEVEQAQMHQAESRIKTQQAAIAAAQASLASFQVKLDNAQNTYDRNQKLFKGNAATQQSVDDSRFAVEDWQKQLAAQKANIAQQQARLEELRADIGLSQTQLAKKTLRAPMSGVFLSCNVKPGNFIASETALGDFARSGPYLALTEVDELYALRVKNGQKAFIRPQGAKEVLATGTVVFVGSYLKKKSLFSDSADNLEDRRVREVKVQLDDNSKVLIGSRVECVIELQ